jgi:hypothetical protein
VSYWIPEDFLTLPKVLYIVEEHEILISDGGECLGCDFLG